jgi:F0F1-type ATP synthase gamma subunit
MKLAVVGSRSLTDYNKVKYNIIRYFTDKETDRHPHFDEIISGGASGADALGKRLAHELNIKYTEFAADWNAHGKSAGYIRNEQIIKHSDKVIAFWDGKSKGTMHSINLARRYKKDTIIIYI